MKKIILLIFSLFIFNALSFAQVKDEAKKIKKDLAEKFFQKYPNKPVKIAVINFDNLSEDSRKASAGQVLASAIAEEFINDSDFIVVERQKLQDIFKELKLNLSGAVDEKDVKRAGLILGVDYLVMGDVSDSNQDFLIQSRITNVENALIVAASSLNIEKNRIFKESEAFFASKNYFSITYDKLISDKINLDIDTLAVELRHNLTKRHFLSALIKTSIGENDKISYKSDPISVTYNNNQTISVIAEETFKSINSFSVNYGFFYNLPYRSIFKLQFGPGMNVIKSSQRFYGDLTGWGTDYHFPYSGEHTYYTLSFNLDAKIDKKIWKTLFIGIGFNYYISSFKRNLDAGYENTVIKPYLAPLNKNIKNSASFIGTSLTFAF